MALETDPPSRLLPPGVLLRALAAGAALSLGVLALWRFAPGLLPAAGLLLVWTAALAGGLALAARQREREGEEGRRRLAAELERSAAEAGSLRRELEGFRALFASRPAERPSPPAPPAPLRPKPPAADPNLAPDNVHSIIRDPLTGLFHRRYFEGSLEREIHRMERHNRPLGIVLMEVDGFDAFSKARGQEAADALLRAVGNLLQRRVRGGDVACRYEGGTFGLILPEAPLEGVQTRAEQIRTSVREVRAGGEDPPVGITLSLGVAAFPDCAHSSEKLLSAAKAALDEARADRDRVAVAPCAVLDRRLMLPE